MNELKHKKMLVSDLYTVNTLFDIKSIEKYIIYQSGGLSQTFATVCDDIYTIYNYVEGDLYIDEYYESEFITNIDNVIAFAIKQDILVFYNSSQELMQEIIRRKKFKK